MSMYVAFLRGMNVGRRRIKNDELCACFTDMGFGAVSAFLASGNVLFDASGRDAATVAKTIEDGLKARLQYAVPTFLRSAAEVTAIAEGLPFSAEELEGAGKPQAAMLLTAPDAACVAAVMAHHTAADRLAIVGRELYWLPEGPMSQSVLDLKAIARLTGPMTIRTHRTITRLVPKLAR